MGLGRGPGQRLAGDLHRPLLHRGGEHRHPDLLAEHVQLLDGRRSVDVGRHQQGRAALRLQLFGQLRGGGGLARALQAGEHDHRRPLAVEAQRLGLAAEQLDQFVVHHFDHLLTGRQAGEHLLTDGLGGDRGHKFPDNAEVDIRLEQRRAHLAHGFLNIFLSQRAMATQLLEDAFQAVGQILKHTLSGVECAVLSKR